MKTKKALFLFTHIKFLLVIPIILIVFAGLTSCGRKKNIDASLNKIALPPEPPKPPKPPTMVGKDTIWQISDEIPLLPGGDKLLMKYIGKNIIYPEAAKIKGIQGQVVVKFFISSKGNVTGHEIFKSINPELDAEALRVLKTLTKFEPTWKNGKPVPAWYYVPINFVLK
jgi:TonB family protein